MASTHGQGRKNIYILYLQFVNLSVASEDFFLSLT